MSTNDEQEATVSDKSQDETTPPENDATDQQQEQTDGGGKAGRDAAKYRTRLREAEAERDALTARLETMQKAEAERLAEHHIARGSGLWAAFELADMLDEDGNVDPAKVATAAKSAQEQLGLSESRHGGRAPLAGRTPALDAGPSRFEAAFGPGE